MLSLATFSTAWKASFARCRAWTGSIAAASVMALCAFGAHAALVPVGVLSWDVNIPNSTGAFDIINFTGPNSTDPFPDFPVTTTVHLSGLSLTVHFVGGGTTVFGPAYFTVSSDTISFDGGDIPIGGANPLPTDATLTGVFSPLTITECCGGGTESILPAFSASIPFDAGGLADGSFAIINATTGTASSVPEPSPLLLLLLAGALMPFVSRRSV